jgi:hypothetical protein
MLLKQISQILVATEDIFAIQEQILTTIKNITWKKFHDHHEEEDLEEIKQP